MSNSKNFPSDYGAEGQISPGVCFMANGAAAALPTIEPTPTDGGESDLIEQRIGTAVADAVAAFGQALIEYYNTGHTTVARTIGADAAARLFWLRQQLVPDADFADIVRREGLRVLRARLGANFLPQNAKAADGLIDGILEIVDRVVAFERAMAH
jgi:hypothetical protein